MAQTLKFGNKTWATKVGSTLAYNDENDNYKPLPFAFTRSTSATRVNKEGLIEVVTNDRPRIDYTDTSDGVLLLEKAATNLIAYSEAFDNSYWTKSGASVVSGQVSPKGDTSAFKLVEDTSTGIHFNRSTTIIGTTGLYYTMSFYAKAKENNWVVNYGGFGLRDEYAFFDLLNGVVGTVSSNATAKIEALSDGWYKCSITSELYNTQALNSYFFTANTDNVLSYTGDGTSGVYIFGAMLEQNSVASSYIPTQGSASTRVAETASGSGNSEVFNDSEGVLFADISTDSENTYKYISINNGTSTGNQNRVALGYYGSNLYPNVRVSNNHQFNETFPLNPTLNTKIALKYKTNDFALWVNGFEVSESNSGSTFSDGTLSKFDFDDGAGNSDFYGKTKEIGYYNTILTDLELETLTSYKSWTSMVNELNLNIIYNG